MHTLKYLLVAALLLGACDEQAASQPEPESTVPKSQPLQRRVTLFSNVKPAPSSIRFEMNSVRREHYKIDLDLTGWTLVGAMHLHDADYKLATPTPLTAEQKNTLSGSLSRTRLVEDSKADCKKKKDDPRAYDGENHSMEFAKTTYVNAAKSCAYVESDDKESVHAMIAQTFRALAKK